MPKRGPNITTIDIPLTIAIPLSTTIGNRLVVYIGITPIESTDTMLTTNIGTVLMRTLA